MDPKVCGKLLTHHRRDYSVDVEALHDRFPLRRSAGKGPKLGSHGYRSLRSWKKGFVSSAVGLRVRKYILMEEVGRWSYEGPTRVGARLPPWARPPASWLPRCFHDFHSKSTGLRLFQKISSRRFRSGWIPFDIPFLQNTEIGKKQQFALGLWLIG